MDNIDKSIGGLFLNCNTAIVQQRVQSQTCLSYAERLHGRVVSKGTDRSIDGIRNRRDRLFDSAFHLSCPCDSVLLLFLYIFNGLRADERMLSTVSFRVL